MGGRGRQFITNKLELNEYEDDIEVNTMKFASYRRMEIEEKIQLTDKN